MQWRSRPVVPISDTHGFTSAAHFAKEDTALRFPGILRQAHTRDRDGMIRTDWTREEIAELTRASDLRGALSLLTDWGIVAGAMALGCLWAIDVWVMPYII